MSREIRTTLCSLMEDTHGPQYCRNQHDSRNCIYFTGVQAPYTADGQTVGGRAYICGYPKVMQDFQKIYARRERK